MSDYSDYQPILKGKRMRLDLQRAESEIRKAIKKSSLSVSLTVSHPTLRSEEITEALGLPPTNALEKNELIAPDHSDRLRAEKTMWTLSTKKYVKEKSAHEHLDWLLDFLDGRTPTLRQWQSEGAHLTIRVRADAWTRFNSFALGSETIARLAYMGIGISFDCHYQNSDAAY